MSINELKRIRHLEQDVDRLTQTVFALVATVTTLEIVLRTIVEADGREWEDFVEQCYAMQEAKEDADPMEEE